MKNFSTQRRAPLFKKSSINFWLDLAINLVIIVAIVVIVRTLVISPFQVVGSSMCDTFNFVDGRCQGGHGEYLIVNKITYQNFFGWQVGLPERGDIVVFHPPHNDQEFFIKRVIGLPGETVKLEEGKVKIFNQENPNGFILAEPYLNDRNRNNTKGTPTGAGNIFEIPPESYLVFGDNRLDSSDARTCFSDSSSRGRCGEGLNSPYLTMEHIEGKASIILWPVSKIGIIKDPSYEN